MKPIEASGMDLDDAKDKLEVKDKAVKDLSSEEMTSKVMANALATSTGYAGRRPLPWLACNLARA